MKEQVGLEQEIERARVKLAYTHDFNLMDAFRIFDSKGKGSVLPVELIEGLVTMGFTEDSELRDAVYLFTRRYDNDNDGKMKYSDF